MVITISRNWATAVYLYTMHPFKPTPVLSLEICPKLCYILIHVSSLFRSQILSCPIFFLPLQFQSRKSCGNCVCLSQHLQLKNFPTIFQSGIAPLKRPKKTTKPRPQKNSGLRWPHDALVDLSINPSIAKRKTVSKRQDALSALNAGLILGNRVTADP